MTPPGLRKEIGEIVNQRKNRDYADYSIVKIGSNNQKSLGDLRILSATQTPPRTIS